MTSPGSAERAANRQPLRLAILEGTRVLTAAGVDSPRNDAELLAAHVVGVDRMRLPLVPLVDPPVIETIRALVARRAKREPLQHILGWAAMGRITVAVGPGVFVPRPETELLLAWGLESVRRIPQPLVVDLCTGSGALALAMAHERPDAIVHAVERDADALSWTRHNAAARAADGDTPITVHRGDVFDSGLLLPLEETVDLVLCNPPYVPAGTLVPAEVREHDPYDAVFSGADGLDTIRQVVSCAARLLRPGGVLAIEHDGSHGGSAPALLRARKVLVDVADHQDLTGRARFVTAAKRRPA